MWELGSAKGAAESDHLHDILLALRAMGTNAAHEEWGSLAQDLQRLHMAQQRMDSVEDGTLDNFYVHSFQQRLAAVQLKASRVGVNETQLQVLFMMLGIEAEN